MTEHLLPVRSAGELAAMREAGRVVAECLAAVSAAAVPGAKLKDLDAQKKPSLQFAEDVTAAAKTEAQRDVATRD